MTELLIAPCDNDAARYSVMNWHYSKRMPMGKQVKFGVWENGKFIGAVLFGRSAAPGLLKPYGLDQTEGCELLRVALNYHQANVSEIVSKCVKTLKKNNPRMRIIVSFADPVQGHYGGIYQAGNWIYLGKSSAAKLLKHKLSGEILHWRTEKHAAKAGKNLGKSGDYDPIVVPGKHRYVYPLDKAMRRQIQSLAQPYPRGSSLNGETADFQSAGPGSIPGNRSNS